MDQHSRIAEIGCRICSVGQVVWFFEAHFIIYDVDQIDQARGTTTGESGIAVLQNARIALPLKTLEKL
jgi:hypothetical protein